jgi:hypothetical protein
VTFRLAYLLVFTDDPQVVVTLGRRAGALAERMGDVEARLLGEFTGLVVRFVRGDEAPPSTAGFFERVESMRELAGECDREDLQFRVEQWSVATNFLMARIPECEEAIERAAELARRLGTPRFSWEVDMNRCMRAADRGDRDASEAFMRRAGGVVRRLRPDLHMLVELIGMTLIDFHYDGKTEVTRTVYEAMDDVITLSFGAGSTALAVALDGDLAAARRRMWAILGEDGELEGLRRPDGQMAATVCVLAVTASIVGDREAGARLRPLLESQRPYLIHATPSLGFGYLPEWCIGRLELLAERHDAAVEELREATARADELGMVWASGWIRVDLARALYGRDGDGALGEVESLLVEGEGFAERYGLGWVRRCALEARAEIEGRTPPAPESTDERPRPLRALATRGGRRALSALVGDLDDAELERRYAEPRRQRTLLKGMARSFQPAQAGDFAGVVAYEIEPFAIESPADAPWRWAIEADARAGKARLIEPAPLDAAVTVHIGLADWVRVLAGLEDPLRAMIAGRCSVEGDVAVGARLQAMFGAQT